MAAEPLGDRINSDSTTEPYKPDRLLKRGFKIDIDTCCFFYTEPIDGLKQLIAKDEIIKSGSNKVMPVPFTKDKKIFAHPDQTNVPENYIRMINEVGDGRSIIQIQSIFNFEPDEIE